jgi:hypothetical protein
MDKKPDKSLLSSNQLISRAQKAANEGRNAVALKYGPRECELR